MTTLATRIATLEAQAGALRADATGKPAEIEHDHTRDPVCPHCGHAVRDAWEIPFGGEPEGVEEGHECGRCEGVFDIQREITVRYTTTARGVAL